MGTWVRMLVLGVRATATSLAQCDSLQDDAILIGDRADTAHNPVRMQQPEARPNPAADQQLRSRYLETGREHRACESVTSGSLKGHLGPRQESRLISGIGFDDLGCGRRHMAASCAEARHQVPAKGGTRVGVHPDHPMR